MDQWSFNDSHWCNLLGSLVEFTNVLDPETPCGFVGGQMPSPFGGYDYAKLMQGAEWIHDGVAIYYNHASIQLGWILDAECHGKTWINRNDDERLSSSALGRKAWENMLRDSGIQYDFINYVDVVQHGVPDKYRVLILPACLCLSDVEARRIEEFCQRGGTVIADFLPGICDQHGKGRGNGGALDPLFGIRHDPQMQATDIFGDRLWVEVDQDANYSYQTYDAFLTNQNTCLKQDCGFNKAVRSMPIETIAQVGSGKAVLMNLSPQWYNAYRGQGSESSKKRDVFMKHVMSADVKPRLRIVDAAEKEHGYEVTYWKLPNNRVLLFLFLNPEIRGTSLGGGNSVGLKSGMLSIKLRFEQSAFEVRNERTGHSLGSGHEFELSWKQNEAVVLSFRLHP